MRLDSKLPCLVLVGCSLFGVVSACSSSDSSAPAAGGSGGVAGSAGAGGMAGTAGTAGAAGSGGAGGTGGASTGARTIVAAAGGAITADGIVLDIPPGALAADTDITLTVSDGSTSPAAATLVAKVYDFGPNGTKFSKPVKLTIAFDAAKLGSKQPVVSFLDAGKWVALSDSAATGGDVVATTTHFTSFGVVGVDAAACLALAKTDCQACCKTTFANGAGAAEPLDNAIKYCGCTSGAPCDADCAANVCQGLAPSTQCQTCLTTVGSANPQPACMTQGQQACAASASCTAYINCALGCP